MGWFSKKKVPKVPFPKGHPLDEDALRFPTGPATGKVIEPKKVKAAVGVDTKPVVKLPSQQPAPKPAPPPKPKIIMGPEMTMDEDPSSDYVFTGPLYVKVEVYQRILGEMDKLKGDLSHLSETQRDLEESEYNEEANFDKLRRYIKAMHDRMLQVDKTLFKS